MIEARIKKRRRKRSRKLRLPVVLSLVAVALLLAGGWAIYKADFFSGTSDRELLSVSQRFVRRDIARPALATFSSARATHIERLPEGKFLIKGSVEVRTESGNIERQRYTCVIYKAGNGQWAAESVNVEPPGL